MALITIDAKLINWSYNEDNGDFLLVLSDYHNDGKPYDLTVRGNNLNDFALYPAGDNVDNYWVLEKFLNRIKWGLEDDKYIKWNLKK